MDRFWIGLGALAGLVAVAAEAAGAHALQGLDAPALAMFHTAAQMQLWHALALLFTGIWAARGGGVLAHLAGAAFALGTLLFCGALYALALRGLRLPEVAPTGGSLLMLGWLLLFVSALRRPR
jgi:uncharacterized membrane protein YgdD (TMEM256/DUF423 family)